MQHVTLFQQLQFLQKVTRDRIMEEWDNVYPMYGFSKHKGYGTREHIEAIKQYGPCTTS